VVSALSRDDLDSLAGPDSIAALGATNGARRRVVVTGIGLVTPLGTGTEATWQGVVTGRSGIRRITRFDTSGMPVQIAGEVPDFEAERWIDRKEARRTDLFVQYALAAAEMAVADAGLPLPLAEPARTGVIVGVGMGGITTLEEAYEAFTRREFRRISPFFIPRIIPNMAAGHVALRFGARGPNFATTSACASGAHAIGEALRLLQNGAQDVMLAGGSEAPVAMLAVGGFAAMRALAAGFNDDPTRASRPFDRDRQGFVIAEGAGMLVLETLEHATARGVRPLAELVGYGSTCDAYHMTQPAPEGAGAAACIAEALADADVAPEAVGYVNAHGTGTPYNDEAETQALKQVLGAHAHRVAVSSTKSMMGHLLGAGGGVEAALTVLAIDREILPPTINLDSPDPACDLDYVPGTARAARVDVAMSNSFGFGGTNVTLVFRRPA
jgi:3-oxoacyl-[acyl-carrier-protein] synthase II